MPLNTGPCDGCGRTISGLIETRRGWLCGECLRDGWQPRESCVLLACVLTGGVVAFAAALLWG